ncbi:MAG: hypothetical protein WED10_00440 [Brumimicrobium sp.]
MSRIIFVFIIFTFCQFSAQAQILKHYNDFELEWGEMFRSSGNVESLTKTKDGQYISLINRTTLYNFFTDYKKRYYLESIENLEPQKRHKLKLYGDGKRTNLEGISVVENQLVALSRKNFRSKRKTGVYYHFLYPNRLDTESEGYQIGMYSNTSSRNQFDFLSITNNLNKTKAGIFYTIPSSGFDYPSYAFGILDATEKLLIKKESLFPYLNKHVTFFDDYLSPNGDYYVLAKEYQTNNTGINWGWGDERYKQIRVFKVVNGKLNDFKINQSEFLFSDLNITTSDGGNLIFSGMYSEDKNSGIHGLFFIKLKPDGTIISKNYHSFSKDFMTSGKPTWSWNRASNRNNTGKFESGLGNFKMQELRKTSDGGYIGVAEHFEIEERYSGSGAPGTSNRIDTYYYYDDLIVYKLNKSGEVEWKKRIPKSQSSTNDGGYYLSIVQTLTDKHLYILFNDDTRNYDDNNFYLNLENPKSARFNARRNTMAVTKITLKTGAINRYSIGGKKELSVIMVPKVSVENKIDNEILLYGRSGKRHRYGSIVFND